MLSRSFLVAPNVISSTEARYSTTGSESTRGKEEFVVVPFVGLAGEATKLSILSLSIYKCGIIVEQKQERLSHGRMADSLVIEGYQRYSFALKGKVRCGVDRGCSSSCYLLLKQ